jgi:uncharacterized damage-inducible protein DinB
MRVFTGLAVVALLCPSAAWAQTPAASGNAAADAIRSEWSTVSSYMKQSAELMDEANYSFKPVDSVRTFGAILAHVAGANYVYCAAAKGEKAPHGEGEFEKGATTKAAIVKALNDSITYCDSAYKAATDASLGQMGAAAFGSRKLPIAEALVGNIGHNNEHYGNLVTYFRIKGIVPPSSRRQQ